MRSLVLVPVLAVALAACGSSGSPEEQAVRDAVKEAYLSPDPAVCEKRYTKQILEQDLGGLELCRSLRTATQPDRIGKFEIESVDMKGERAIVRVRTENLGRERLVLVDSDSGWKIEDGQRL